MQKSMFVSLFLLVFETINAAVRSTNSTPAMGQLDFLSFLKGGLKIGLLSYLL